MKSLAKSVVWWPKIDADIEGKVKKCEKCQPNQKKASSITFSPKGVAQATLGSYSHQPCGTLQIQFQTNPTSEQADDSLPFDLPAVPSEEANYTV